MPDSPVQQLTNQVPPMADYDLAVADPALQAGLVAAESGHLCPISMTYAAVRSSGSSPRSPTPIGRGCRWSR